MFKSIEDTGDLYIGNSVVELSGALDVQSDATKVGNYYTLNTITNALTIYNNTTLYTQRGFNKVGGFYSYVNQKSTKATVSIDENGVAETNVDNRLYTLEGINLVFAKVPVTLTNKASIALENWGEVTGMAYFGMYKNTLSGTSIVKEYDLDLFRAGTYVEGQYNSSHNVEVDGFYTDVEVSGTEQAQIIQTTNYDKYCDWIINAPTLDYEVDLIASTYGHHSVAELLLNYKYASDYTYAPETVYTLNQVSSNALKPDVTLVDKDDISTIGASADANNKFALTMETTTSGWKEQAVTSILSTGTGYAGDTEYASDSGTSAGKLKFKVWNSLNITEEKDLGAVNIVMTGQQPISGGNGTDAYTFNVVIQVNLQTIVDVLKEQYTPSFTDRVETDLDYTTDSRVYLSYLLYKNMETSPYADNQYRVLSTSTALPAGTRITLKDYGQGDSVNKVYYYHVTGAVSDETGESLEYTQENGRYLYRLSNFVEMGSTNSPYEDSSTAYWHDNGSGGAGGSGGTGGSGGYVLEKYDVSIDFIDSGIGEKLAQETYLELRYSSGYVKYDNGDTTIKYDLLAGKNAVPTLDITTDQTSYSVVDTLDIPITIDEASLLEQAGVIDTKYHDQIAGIAIQIVDTGSSRIKSPDLQNFKLTNALDSNEVYEADINGVIRMPIIEGLGSMSGDYILSLTQATVPPGTYRVQVLLYTADDGKYYGDTTLAMETFNVTFISRLLGTIGVEADYPTRIINQSTGLNLAENTTASKAVDMTVSVGSPTADTNIRVELYKRTPTYTGLDAGADQSGEGDGGSVSDPGVVSEPIYTGTTYELVDIAQYLQGEWTAASEGSKEYIISPKGTYNGTESVVNIEFEKAVVEGISTGEYKLVFKAYSNDTLVQEVRKTFIITP